jgi:hypothetical protein
MKTAALAQVSKTGSRPTGQSPASATLKTDWAVGEMLPQSLQPSSNTQAAAKNGSSGRDSHRKSPSIAPAFRSLALQTSNGDPGSFNPELCGGSRLSQTLAW